MSLYDAKWKKCIIETIPNNQLLRALGLREGLEININTKQLFGGPIVVSIGKRSIAISKEIAQDIVVREVA